MDTILISFKKFVKWHIGFVALLLLVAIEYSYGGVSTLRCGNKTISINDLKSEVAAKCGKPTLSEHWTEERTDAVYFNDGRLDSIEKKYTIVDQWTYNFGPQVLLIFLTFKNGRLSEIETGGHGYETRKLMNSDKERCGQLVSEGDRKIEVLKKCGIPSSTEEKEIKVGTTYNERERKIFTEKSVRIDEWTYNFGPRHFVYTFRFKNGRVTEKIRGDYGY